PSGPKGTLRVDEAEAVRALLDPRRQRLLKRFVTPRSVKEVAEQEVTTPSRLYYHVRLLERHGILRAVEQRRAGSNTEHVYQLSARRFEVAAGLGGVVRAGGTGLTARLVETAQRYASSIEDRSGGPRDRAVRAVHEAGAVLTHQQAQAVLDRLQRHLDELAAADADPPAGARRYGIHLMVAPMRPDSDEVG
ncbi:MAG TPA: helix-turn-helix domain-containing protein, partial [Actinomycetota bacterium]|nr:helix-turn-helix domain-containing protein [Actinomycetota bacterium]